MNRERLGDVTRDLEKIGAAMGAEITFDEGLYSSGTVGDGLRD